MGPSVAWNRGKDPEAVASPPDRIEGVPSREKQNHGKYVPSAKGSPGGGRSFAARFQWITVLLAAE